jgi:hypothetical protein
VLGFALAKLVSGYSTLEILAIFLVLFLAYYLITVSYTLMNVFITMMLAFLYDLLMGGITLSLPELLIRLPVPQLLLLFLPLFFLRKQRTWLLNHSMTI